VLRGFVPPPLGALFCPFQGVVFRRIVPSERRRTGSDRKKKVFFDRLVKGRKRLQRAFHGLFWPFSGSFESIFGCFLAFLTLLGIFLPMVFKKKERDPPSKTTVCMCDLGEKRDQKGLKRPQKAPNGPKGAKTAQNTAKVARKLARKA